MNEHVWNLVSVPHADNPKTFPNFPNKDSSHSKLSLRLNIGDSGPHWWHIQWWQEPFNDTGMIHQVPNSPENGLHRKQRVRLNMEPESQRQDDVWKIPPASEMEFTNTDQSKQIQMNSNIIANRTIQIPLTPLKKLQLQRKTPRLPISSCHCLPPSMQCSKRETEAKEKLLFFQRISSYLQHFRTFPFYQEGTASCDCMH